MYTLGMTTLTIINENIPKYQQLLNNVKPNTVIETIPNDVNGVSLLNEIIQKYSNIDSLHIISHGTPGKINLGNSILGSEEYNFHQAMFEVEETDQDPGIVVQVLQAGYAIDDRILRPAMVGVAAAKGGKKSVSVDTTA